MSFGLRVAKNLLSDLSCKHMILFCPNTEQLRPRYYRKWNTTTFTTPIACEMHCLQEFPCVGFAPNRDHLPSHFASSLSQSWLRTAG